MKRHGGRRPGSGRPKKVKVTNAPKPSIAMRSLMKMTAEQMQEMARENAAQAIATLVQVATESDKDAARVSAATELLNRAFGKVPVPSAKKPGVDDHRVQDPDKPVDAWDGLLN